MTPSEIVTLPVGIRIDGSVYRTVRIAEMNGFDEENINSKRVRNNGAKAQTLLLRRCIQEIEGLIPRKSNSNELIDERYVLEMSTFDRDYLFFAIRLLGEIDSIDTTITCGYCNESDDYSVSVEDLDVYDWEDDAPLSIKVSLARGFHHEGAYHADCTWSFLNGKQLESIMNTPEDRLLTTTMMMSITDVAGMDFRPTEEMIRRLPSRERMMLLEDVAAQAPGLQTNITRVCSCCGESNTVAIEVARFFNSGSRPKNNRVKPGPTTQRKLRSR